MHPFRNNNSTYHDHNLEDITGLMVYDCLLQNEEAVYDTIHCKPLRSIEIAHIQQGDVGVFGITGSKARSLFIVIDKAEDCYFWTREHRKDGCRTFKRKLTYERKGLRDSLYIMGFVGAVDLFSGGLSA